MRRMLAVAFLIVGFACVGMISCDSDTGTVKKEDAGKQDLASDLQEADLVPHDTAEPPDDQSQWPDGPVPDQWPTTDMYSGAPFGCQTDEDCFGQKCCKTPWGVKLCATSCD